VLTGRGGGATLTDQGLLLDGALRWSRGGAKVSDQGPTWEDADDAGWSGNEVLGWKGKILTSGTPMNRGG
jgi:hypothetical protein